MEPASDNFIYLVLFPASSDLPKSNAPAWSKANEDLPAYCFTVFYPTYGQEKLVVSQPPWLGVIGSDISGVSSQSGTRIGKEKLPD